MGEYNLNTGDNYIIVDGHICVEVSPSIYKFTDVYETNIEEWSEDERNKDLYAIFKVNSPEDHVIGILLYIGTDSYTVTNRFMNVLSRDSKDIYYLLAYGPTNPFHTDSVILTLLGEEKF